MPFRPTRALLRAAIPAFACLIAATAGLARAETPQTAVAPQSVRNQLKTWEGMGLGHLPICIAKTQYSFSTDPNAKGAPTGHELEIREVRLSNGAEFVVAIAGEIMTMPGLPRVPAATKIALNDEGKIEGLF